MNSPKFTKDEKVLLKNQLIHCTISDIFPCSDSYYYVNIDGELFKKFEYELDYSFWKKIRIFLKTFLRKSNLFYYYMFGKNYQQTKESTSKILFGIIIGLLLSLIFKK